MFYIRKKNYNMKKSIFTLIFLFSINLGFSQDDNYKNLLTDFLNAQGNIQTFDSTFNQMADMFGVSVDDEKFNELKTEMVASLIEKMVPVYKNHFSETDLKEAILMFGSPIGKKISEKAPIIAQESMKVSMEWGMEIGQKMQGLIK
jgi:galactitol-specific phosphotransferase system IIC component